MPHELPLPKRLKARGWKVKIREKERLEPPHITILCGKKEWRVSLRDETFLVPPGGSWTEIDDQVQNLIARNWQDLQDAWDMKYPSNPISSKVEDDDENR
jgi:hypothetical protein